MSERTGQARTVVTVYPMTGRQLGILWVPHAFCVECDLTVRLVERVTADMPGVEVRTKPWFSHLFDALRRGGWHPPVVAIDGQVFTQGIVPDESRLRRAVVRGSKAAPVRDGG